MSALPEYDRLADRLESIDFEVGASELHGVLSGLLCAGHAEAHADWIESLFRSQAEGDLLVQEAREMLGQLYFGTMDQLRGGEMAFSVFLPDDENNIGSRSAALAQWCEGYLYGLGLAGIDAGQLAPEGREMLSDLTELTRLDYEQVEPGEQSEQAFMEIEQFLRVAVLTLYQEFSALREASSGSE